MAPTHETLLLGCLSCVAGKAMASIRRPLAPIYPTAASALTTVGLGAA